MVCNTCWLKRKVCKACLIKRLESIEDTDAVEIEEHKSAKKTIKAAVKKVKQIASPFLKIVKSYAEVVSGPTSSVSLPAIVPFCSPLLGATIEKKTILLSSVSSAATDNSTTPASISVEGEKYANNQSLTPAVVVAKVASENIKEYEELETTPYRSVLLYGSASPSAKKSEKPFTSTQCSSIKESIDDLITPSEPTMLITNDTSRYDRIIGINVDNSYHEFPSVNIVKSQKSSSNAHVAFESIEEKNQNSVDDDSLLLQSMGCTTRMLYIFLYICF